jgi:hypothetical protein
MLVTRRAILDAAGHRGDCTYTQSGEIMKLFKRGLLAVAMIAATAAAVAPTASATLRPTSPYSFTTGTGTFVSRTVLGTSSCNLSGIAGTLTGVTGGATGVVTSIATISGCSGLITAANARLVTAAAPINASIVNGVTTLTNVRLLITNALGGQCLYAGTLRGTWTSPTSTITAGGSVALVTNLNGGFCSNPADATLSVTVPGAIISAP